MSSPSANVLSYAGVPREPLNKSPLARRWLCGMECAKATTRMVQPRRAEQRLPEEDATP
jgi:hypothetical protein